jgi:Putative peptidoglycan binding domain
MKKFTSVLIGCSLALAGIAFAQPEPEQSPKGKKQGIEKTERAEPKTHAAKPEATTKTHAAEVKSGANAANPEATTAKPTGAMKEHGATTEPGARKHDQTSEEGGRKVKATEKSATATGTETNVSGEPTASAAPGGKHQHGEKGIKAGAGANAKASAAPSASAAPTVAAAASAAPSVSTATQANAQTGTAAGVKKADPQKVQQVKQQTAQIKQQHVNFKAQPKPDKVPPVTFNVNYRIQGSDRWSGPQYEVFRSYHPERHERNWYHSHYTRVELIGGGYYYWNNGYWYPAWGYDPGAEYYAYDAPIYVGHRAEPPDRVIADVQAELQEMGYYHGEVDGLLGPLTRQALTDYQADQGLQVTAVIDEPTLDSLGMS